MSGFGNRDYEISERRVEEERAALIAAASARVSGEGAVDCIDCDTEIDPARRAALPSARRCVTCQERLEGAK